MNLNKKALNLSGMTQTALCIALLTVSSYLAIPLPLTPIVLSFHTVVVNMIGLILGWKHAAYTILVYLLMGLIGLPVFSGGAAGPGKLFGATGGFYFGFLFAVIVISLLKGKGNKFTRYSIVTICAGLPVQHLLGIIFMCFYNDFDIGAATAMVSLPFIPADIIKCIIASMIAVSFNKGLAS